MASSDARPIPRKNVAYRVTFPIFDADGDLVSSAADLDSEVDKDGAGFSDCTSEATEIGSNGIYYLDLTADEMSGDTVSIIIKTSTSGAKTTPIILYPEEAGDIRVDVVQVSGDSTSADNLELDYDGTGYNKANSVIGTTTTNTDMRGTDSALLAANVTLSGGVVESNLVEIGGVSQSATDLKDFADDGYDPATNKVEGVKLVDTTTTNTDVRGTDSAATAASLATAQSDLDTITGADGTTLATNQANYAPAKAGDNMGLANDSITSAKYDESSAFPIKSDDSGATQIARVGADSDTLETLSDQLDVVQTDLDNPSQYKADVSGLATTAALSTHDGKLDTVDSNVDSVLDDTGTSGVIVATNNDKTDYSLSTASIQAIWDKATSALTTAGSIGKLIVDNLNSTISGVATAVWANATRTLSTGVTLTNAGIDSILTRAISNSEASATSRCLLWAISKLTNKVAITSTTLSVKKTDDSTNLFTQTVTTDSGADPIVGVDTD